MAVRSTTRSPIAPADPVPAVAAALTLAIFALAACAPRPPPRSFSYFMEDSIARDGVLARCDLNPEEALNDIECANAGRAATAVQLRLEQERSAALQLESERKIEALRREFEARQQAQREARAAYETQ